MSSGESGHCPAFVLQISFCVNLGVCWIINAFLMTTAVLDIRTTLKTLIFLWWSLWTMRLTPAYWSRARDWVEKPWKMVTLCITFKPCLLASVIKSFNNQCFGYKTKPIFASKKVLAVVTAFGFIWSFIISFFSVVCCSLLQNTSDILSAHHLLSGSNKSRRLASKEAHILLCWSVEVL